MRFLAAIISMLILAALCYSQPAELHAAVSSPVDQRRYADALSGLKAIEEKHSEIFRANDYDYLTARMLEKSGNLVAAAPYYQSVVKRNSILKRYALLHLADGARSSGNLMLERIYLEEIAAFYPDSLIADAAANRLARSWLDSGNYDRSIRAFEALSAGRKTASGKTVDDPVGRENRLLLGRAHMLSGNMAAARDIFSALINNPVNTAQPDDFALAAAKGLDRLDLAPGAASESVPKLSDYEHLHRASIYQFNRDFADARRHYSAAIISDHPSSGIVPDAIFQTGRGHAQEANFPEAIKWFERVIEQFPDHAASKDALLQAASAYSRVGKLRESIKRYQDYIAKYPADERVDRAYLNIIDVLRDEGEEAEAHKWAAKVRETFRGKLPEALALFAEVRIDLARNNWDAGLAGLNQLSTLPDLGGATVPGGTTKAEVAFLRGFVFEQKRNFADAIDAYLSVTDGRGEYYGWRATERLQELAKNQEAKSAIESKLNSLPSADSKDHEASRRNVQSALRLTTDPTERIRLLDSLRRIYSNLPAYKKVPVFKPIVITRTQPRNLPRTAATTDSHRAIAEDLAFLGLFDEAAPEFEASQKIPVPPAGDLAYTIAMTYKRGDKAHKAVAFVEPLWRGVPADYQIELMPREHVELLYPAPYADAFLKHAAPRNLDPRFMLSIVRQESRYRPDIKSYAAARGMMQFISTTSEKIAAELGRNDFDQDELYDPATAILFGSQYTSNLFKLFPNQPEGVAASYNGGEDNMKRWMKRSKSDLADRYVPEIAFSQSKDYVYKVMANYRVYKIFYEERLALRPGV